MKQCKICVPITGKNGEEILGQAQAIREHRLFSAISCVEFRYDLARELDLARLPALLAALRDELFPCRLLFTIRTDIQGGAFPYEAGAYERINQIAIESDAIHMVDVELLREGYGSGWFSRGDQNSAERLMRLAKGKGVQVIASHHDFLHTPPLEELLLLFYMMRNTGADILKLACMPEQAEDVFTLLRATRAFREVDKGSHEYISMSMGELGRASRLLGSLSGSDYSFATVGEASAPGQLTLEDTVEGLRVLEGSAAFMPKSPAADGMR